MYAHSRMTGAAMEDSPISPEFMSVSIDARIASEDNLADDRRRADRAPVDVEARVRALGDEGCEARVLNISATGFMAETHQDFAVGARIWLIIPGRDRANALVRWSDGERIGAEFAAPIDTADLVGRNA